MIRFLFETSPNLPGTRCPGASPRPCPRTGTARLKGHCDPLLLFRVAGTRRIFGRILCGVEAESWIGIHHRHRQWRLGYDD